MRAHYSEDEVVVWLVNPQDGFDQAFGWLGGADVELPTLFDGNGTVYRSYPQGEAEAYAPFPVHVIIDQQGVIRYLDYQYDADAVRRSIDELLAE